MDALQRPDLRVTEGYRRTLRKPRAGSAAAMDGNSPMVPPCGRCGGRLQLNGDRMAGREAVCLVCRRRYVYGAWRTLPRLRAVRVPGATAASEQTHRPDGSGNCAA
jgi:hypothetical protein